MGAKKAVVDNALKVKSKPTHSLEQGLTLEQLLGVALIEDGGGFCADGSGMKAPRELFPAGRSLSA